MRLSHLRYLCCPSCLGDLLIGKSSEIEGDRVKEGELVCERCPRSFTIRGSIPRFVSSENYAKNFGWQWNLHDQTQVDRHAGTKISETRFFRQTGWPRQLHGEVILEAGCGSGRFTEQALSTGAMVCSFDYSTAVEATYRNAGSNENLLAVQADIYAMPFRPATFDRVFCVGVLQHTPRVRESFEAIAQRVKPGGAIAIDVSRWVLAYALFDPRRYVQLVTRRMDHERLYRGIERYVSAMWPLTRRISRLPGGRRMNRILLIPDYRGIYDLSEDQLRAWVILDTFDMLSAQYDQPQRQREVERWFRVAGFKDVSVKRGANGLEGTGVRME